MSKKPTAKDLAFTTARVAGHSATESARIAHIKQPNKVAHRYDKKPRNRSVIEAHQAVAMAHAEITGEKILTELWRVGSLDIRQAFNPDGTLKLIGEMPEDIARAIAGVDVDELFEGVGADRKVVGVTKKIRFWPKVAALDLLGKNKKLWDEMSPLSGVPMVINIVPAHNLPAPDPGH